MYRCVNPHIRTSEELGIAYLGNPQTAIVPVSRKNLIDRAEYGRKLAKMENGIFTPLGYFVPRKKRKEKR